ncbi:dihydrodipicolinate synthase family protein [Intrasporangium mesophilum]
MTDLRGVLSAVATPFDANGDLDEKALRVLIERTIEGGVHGLVPCGSTGEFAQMTNEERRRVVEVVVDQAGGRVPVVAHTGAMTTREALGLAQHAEAVGAAAIMAVAPYYEPLEVEEVKDYFRAVAESVTIPVVVYNLPVATGVNLTPDDIAELATSVPNIEYVKDTSGDFSQAARLIHDYADVVKTLVGWDTLFLASVVEGAAGSIVGASNFIAPQLVAVYDAVQAGDLPTAKAEWDAIFPVMQFLVSGGYVAAVKGALDLLGAPVGSPRAPISPLGEARRDELAGILNKLDIRL